MKSTTTLTTQSSPKFFEKAIASLNRKAKRLNLPLIEYTLMGSRLERKVSEVILIDGSDANTRHTEVDVTVYDYEVTHLDVKQGDWKLLGRLSSDGSGNTCVDQFADEMNREQWETRNPCDCDHCQTRRSRKFGWAVQNQSTGEELLVGSSCMRELVDGVTAAALEFAAHVVSFIRVNLEEGFGGESQADIYCPVIEALAAVELTLEHGEWVDNVRDTFGDIAVEGTHRHVANRLRQFGLGVFELTPELLQKAEDIREALLDIDTKDEFLSDLQYLLRKEAIPTRKLGLLCYAHRALERHNDRVEAEALKATRKHFGEVKKRYDLELKGVRCSSFEGGFGMKHINVFEDADRNVFVWKTGAMSCEEGETYVLKGTVKEHSHYNGTPQTLLTRCKWMNQPTLC